MITKLPDEEAIFKVACQIPSLTARADYLNQVCGDDSVIFERIQALLRVHEQESRFLVSPPPGVAATLATPALAESVGTLIGPYKLLEQIGEGGMGVVYMAQQTQPVKRKVALKVIKPGMDSKQVVARFEAERQALAMMDHPNIARVLDAGSTENGRPYFVMDLVRGVPITEYCDKQKLNMRDRLKLFLDVCHAVQHAHLKGIIHRDLKPSNVLITLHDGTPVVKVIDFGVAKALNQELTEKTLFTQFSQMVGTPLYMSPEQAELSGLDVDTRTDVYSLGVLLYELLTGTTPFDKERLKNAGFDEMRRIIREDEPPKPSTRISTLRAAGESTAVGMRGSDPRQLSRLLRDEIDWIVMKSLEKDRSRRYESASALAADIQRYLSDEPVLACPPTTMYRFQKFARKHQPALLTAAAIALCLILGTTVSAWQAVRATTAEVQASANATQAQEKAQEATTQRDEAQKQRDEAQRQRDEVKALNDKLAAKEQQLQRSLYASNMNLAKTAWDAGNIERVNELLDQHRSRPGEADLRGFEWHYFNRLCNQEILTFKGHTSAVTCVTFSPDGKRLASGDWNFPSIGAVKVWDAQTGKELLSLKGETARIYTVVFSADGKRLASADGKAVKVWDAQTGQQLLSRENDNITRVMFSWDGKHLVCRDDKKIKIWDAETGQELRSFDGLAASLTLSPDGKSLASSDGNEVKIRDLKTGQEALTIIDNGRVLAFSPDGKRLVSAMGGLRVWDAQTGEKLLTLAGPRGFSMSFSPDGKRFVSGLKVWDLQTGQVVLTLSGGGNASFSPDGKRLIGGGEKSVKVWDAESGQEIVTYKGHTDETMSLAISPDGKRVASASLDKTVKIWDAEPVSNPLTLKGVENTEVGGVTFSPDGKRLASAGGVWDAVAKNFIAGEVKVWDAQSGQQLFALKGHTDKVNTVAFSPDSKRLASASRDNTVKVWDSQTGRELLTFTGHAVRVSGVAFSPDGKRLATAAGGEFKVWDAQTGEELPTLKASSAPAPKFGPAKAGGGSNVTFSPDGKRIASVAQPGVKVWDAQTGEELFACKAPPGSPAAFIGQARNVAFSPDGKRLASPYGDNTVKLWDAQTGEELLTFKGHSDRVYSIAFSADGKRLASGSDDKTVRVWDTQTGVELLSHLGHDGRVNSVAFSPDGHRLASASGGSVKICDATPLPEKP